MQEETFSILYQKMQSSWSKKSIYTLEVFAKPSETDYEMVCASGKSGRRKLVFGDRSERSKRIKPKDLRKNYWLS
jgi:hypothetical protein